MQGPDESNPYYLIIQQKWVKSFFFRKYYSLHFAEGQKELSGMKVELKKIE